MLRYVFINFTLTCCQFSMSRCLLCVLVYSYFYFFTHSSPSYFSWLLTPLILLNSSSHSVSSLPHFFPLLSLSLSLSLSFLWRFLFCSLTYHSLSYTSLTLQFSFIFSHSTFLFFRFLLILCYPHFSYNLFFSLLFFVLLLFPTRFVFLVCIGRAGSIILNCPSVLTSIHPLQPFSGFLTRTILRKISWSIPTKPCLTYDQGN